ncbi:hypothetical protein D9M68_970730 [compost metagenome]
MSWLQDLQTLFDGEARSHDENGAGEIFIAFWVGERIEHLPGDDHCHHGGFAAPGRHLVAEPFPGPTIAMNSDTLLEIRWGFDVPN